MDFELIVLAVGFGGAALSVTAVVHLLRGRTPLSPVLLGVIAVVGFYLLGNLFNRVLLPAIFGEPLQAMLEHRRPTLSMVDMIMLSWVLALMTTIVTAMIVARRCRPRAK
jgi:hypothetical protein